LAELGHKLRANRRALFAVAIGALLVAGTDTAQARRHRSHGIRYGRYGRRGWYGRQGWGVPALLFVIGAAGVVILAALAWERWRLAKRKQAQAGRPYRRRSHRRL
jgi:hypothetical protein